MNKRALKLRQSPNSYWLALKDESVYYPLRPPVCVFVCLCVPLPNTRFWVSNILWVKEIILILAWVNTIYKQSNFLNNGSISKAQPFQTLSELWRFFNGKLISSVNIFIWSLKGFQSYCLVQNDPGLTWVACIGPRECSKCSWGYARSFLDAFLDHL